MSLGLITDFIKVIGYKINIQKLFYFYILSNEHIDLKIKYIVPFTITPK